METLYNVMVPLPSIAEQEIIIEEIDRLYSLADAVETTLELSFRQSERLRQSILKKAFQGELVPQDPEDEPAADLLARLKGEKAGQMTTGREKKGERANRKLF